MVRFRDCLANRSSPHGIQAEIETGAAEILCTLSGTQPKRYSISIEEINLQDSGTQNMVIRVTDPELLRETGGIVQGMSGSPILQNGKLIGAVTHVFVDDPTCGYAIFCENMYRYGGAGAESETPLK
ncbi:MAG: SpoIVB peptidase S55 domain-containing protein [Ruminococcus sp.]